ncbi:MAG TPA: hypothetical protein VNK82_14445 [Terriglobales bacterium]|nr:hypothetical protein [Terriglobales bacterium]
MEAVFEQAAIPIQDPASYEELKTMVERVLEGHPEPFLKLVELNKLDVRNIEEILARGLMERALEGVNWLDRFRKGGPGRAKQLYEALPLSDQGHFREYYLSRIEQVDDRLRAKYRNAYWNYY